MTYKISYAFESDIDGWYVWHIDHSKRTVVIDSDLFATKAQAQSLANTLMADDAAWQWMMDVDTAQAPMELPA